MSSSPTLRGKKSSPELWSSLCLVPTPLPAAGRGRGAPGLGRGGLRGGRGRAVKQGTEQERPGLARLVWGIYSNILLGTVNGG